MRSRHGRHEVGCDGRDVSAGVKPCAASSPQAHTLCGDELARGGAVGASLLRAGLRRPARRRQV